MAKPTNSRKRRAPTSSSSPRAQRSRPISSSSSSCATAKKKVQVKSNTDFLSKLQTLRDFLPDSSFSEQDISKCLRECGYNIELAAERLMTGQFQCTGTPSKTARNQTNSSNNIARRGNNSIQASKPIKSSRSSQRQSFTTTGISQSTTPQLEQKNNTKTSSPVIIIDTSSSDDSDEHEHGKGGQDHVHRKTNLSPKLEIATTKLKSVVSNSKCIEKNTTHTNKKVKLAIKDSDNSKPKSGTTQESKKPIRSSSSSSSRSVENSQSQRQTKNNNDQPSLLLCKRWIVACSTSIRGSVQYHETIRISTSPSPQQPFASKNNSSMNTSASSSRIISKNKKVQKGMNVVRFKGRNVEGTLDPKLSSILSPLLRWTSDDDYYSSNSCDADGGLIKVEALALMGDSSLRIGSEVPLQLTVSITRPKDFFGIFDEDGSVGKGMENSKHAFFGRASKSRKGTIAQSRGGCTKTCSAAAFGLLQWAKYGNVVSVDLPSLSSLNNSEDDEVCVKDEIKDDDISGNGECSVDVEKEDIPDWADSLLYGDEGKGINKATDQIDDNNDPEMMKEKGVVLRQYQRQALKWMVHREKDAKNKESADLIKNLELLSELVSTKLKGQKDPDILCVSDGNKESDIYCDIGQVQVSEKKAKEATTLDGNSSSVIHPLWEKRYLWDNNSQESDGREVYSFFVNELLHTASKNCPNAPKQCCGGILADDMGLGKTVMLLSLISKTKEESNDNDGDISDKLSSSKSSSTDDANNNNEDDISSAIKGYKSLSAEEKVLIENVRDDIRTGRKDARSSESILKSKSTTLVVAPLSLLSQWEEEISSKTSLTCYSYYSDSMRKTSSTSNTQFNNYDVVVTTYGMVQNEYSAHEEKHTRLGRSTLLSFEWSRVILDEAHVIKNPKTSVSKGCCALQSESRWCVTGTPIQNSLEDVYGLMKFLRHEPWCDGTFWKASITCAITTGSEVSRKDKTNASPNDMDVALDRVRRVLNPLILRRTKNTLTSDGKPILILPPVEYSKIEITLSFPERQFYNALLNRSQAVFEGLIRSGTAKKSWFTIFSLLQRLRQACNHVALSIKTNAESGIFSTNTDSENDSEIELITEQKHLDSDDTIDENVLSKLLDTFHAHQEKNTKGEGDMKNQQITSEEYSNHIAHTISQAVHHNDVCVEDECECPICLERPDFSNLAVTPCAHYFCGKCLIEVLNQKKEGKENCEGGKCPVCLAWVDKSKVVMISKSTSSSKVVTSKLTSTPLKKKHKKLILERALNESSSKMKAIFSELDKIWNLDPNSKVVIFSQQLGFLDLLQGLLRKRGVTQFILTGKMTRQERTLTLREFNSFSSPAGKDTNDGTVLLASMKACGVGVNLVAASSVFIVDPWWNSATEEQCINRIHRIGQVAKIVRVRKFLVQDTVEEYIVNMQQRKKGIENKILSSEAGGTLGAESANPTLEDFKSIFGR